MDWPCFSVEGCETARLDLFFGGASAAATAFDGALTGHREQVRFWRHTKSAGRKEEKENQKGNRHCNKQKIYR